MLSYKIIDGELCAFESNPLEKKEKLYNLQLKKSNIPEFYWNIDFEDYKGNQNSDEIKKIKFYADNIDKDEMKYVNLYLWGLQATQKTALCCNILKQAIRKNLRVKFILAGDLIDLLMKIQGFSYKEEFYNIIEDLKLNYDLIAIDDIGDIQKSIMWQSDNKSMIITEWDRFLRKVTYNGTKIVMTSNFDVTIFKQYFGESIYSLIDRNFTKIHLTESVKEIRKLNVEQAFNSLYSKTSTNLK
jgi:DNA replication protein DnaC